VCQEALMNVYRHAFARTVTVTLAEKRGEVRLEVRDDGVGVEGGVESFDQGVGVASMRCRMREVGGEVAFDCRGRGFAVTARLPGPARRPSAARPAGGREAHRAQPLP